MNDIIDSIAKHIPSMAPNSFMVLDDGLDKSVILGLLGDRNGTIWLIEMSRETGQINQQTKQKIGECQ